MEIDEYEIRGALSELAEVVARLPAPERDAWRTELRKWAALANIPGAPPYADLARVWLDLAEIVWGDE
jgi:hypothetical protein